VLGLQDFAGIIDAECFISCCFSVGHMLMCVSASCVCTITWWFWL